MLLKSQNATKKGSKNEYSCSMSGELFYRHHEEPRLKLHDPENGTLLIPLKYVDVMRLTQTSTNNVSELLINDMWTEAKGVHLSEEWSATARFQILRTRLLEGHSLVNGRLTQVHKTTRPDSFWPEAWTHLSKKHKEK